MGGRRAQILEIFFFFCVLAAGCLAGSTSTKNNYTLLSAVPAVWQSIIHLDLP